MKNLLLFILLFLIFISIGINIYFFSGKGIIINNDNRIDNRSDARVYSNQSQSQIMLNMQLAQGKPELIVKCKQLHFANGEENEQKNFIQEVFKNKSLITFHLSKMYFLDSNDTMCIAYYEIVPEEWKIKKRKSK